MINWNLIKPPKKEEEKKIDWTTIGPPKEPKFKLEKAPEEKKTFFGEIKKIFEAKPIAQIAKAQVSYNISQKTGLPIEEVHKNLDKITKDLGIRGIPTSEEFITVMFAFPITAGLIAHPVTTGIGIAKFLALAEAENFTISKLKKWDYKFGAGVGLKELLPEETSRLTKDIVDVADFIGKGLIIAKTSPKIMKMWQKFSKEVIETSSPVQQMFISAKKIKTSGMSEAQVKQFFGLTPAQYNNAVKKGIDIRVPAIDMVTLKDTPIWAKIKGLFQIKPYSKSIITMMKGKIKPADIAIVGKVGVKPKVPTEPKIKPKVEYQLPAITGIRSEHPIHFYIKSDIADKFPDAKIFEKNIEKARKMVVTDKELDDLSNYNIEEEFGSLENYYNWVKQNKTEIKSVEGQYDKFIDKLPIDDKTKTLWKEDPENFELNYEDYLKRVKLEVKPKVPEIPIIKTKEEIVAAEKYGIPLEKVHITKVEEAEPEAEAVSKLIKAGERLEEIPEPTKEDLEFIEKGFETITKKEFVAKVEADLGKEALHFVPPEIMAIPSMAEVQNIATKMASIVSIEAPFIKAGAKETGFQVKNYYSNIGLSHQKALKEINNLNKFNFGKVTAKESGFKASGEIDYTDITYLSERPGYFVKLTPEERKLVSPAKLAIKKFYADWEKKLKEIGWLEEPFPKSLITRNNRMIGNMKASLSRIKSPEARIKVLAEIKRLQDQNNRIKKQKIQFVSVPAKAILAKMDTDPNLRAKIMSILPHWGRTTITVKDLVDAKIITRKEADIRAIIGEYSDRMGRKYALGKIFENAEKEGLIKSSAEKPDWPTARIFIKGQHVSIPQLRGKRLDPFFSDVITDFFSRDQVTLGVPFGVIKMMQFHNPLFMPMYDVQQSAAAGLIRTIKAPIYIGKGIKDRLLKTDNWERAFENGLFSKPFVIPYDKWEFQFTEAMKDNKMGEFLKKAALPTNWIPMLYTASWRTAWYLDETVRMMTFNMFQDQGMNDRDAAQLAALYHSDYASVPPRTRKALNKVFFTPTFKITMGKLYLNMLESSIKVVTKGKSATQKEKNLAKGALTALAILMGRKIYMQSKGFKETELFRKYVKMTETDEGLKEDVVTFSDPFNIPFRYIGRVKGAFKPQTTNVAEKMLQIVKWDLHPIHRVAIDVVDNYNWNVYNPYDGREKIAKDILIYTTGEFVKITKSLLESAKAGEIKADAFKALQKDFGKFEAIILKPFVFNYLRETKDKRKVWAIQKLRKDFSLMMIVSPSKDPKVNYERLQNFNKRMKKIIEEFQ